jgi:hypothetical protein
MRTKKKKTIPYQFGLNDEIKKNKIFIKEFKKEIVRIRIKLKTSLHDQINLNMLNFSTQFLHKKL